MFGIVPLAAVGGGQTLRRSDALPVVDAVAEVLRLDGYQGAFRQDCYDGGVGGGEGGWGADADV